MLVVEDHSAPGGSRGVLVEKMLDTESFRWTKWNDNAGAVDGKRVHMPIDVDFQMKEMQREKAPLDMMGEESGDESISQILNRTRVRLVTLK